MMKRRRAMLPIITLILFVTSVCAQIPQNAKVEYDGKALKVPITDDSFIDMATHWHEQAYSGLFAAIAAKKLNEVPAEVQEKLSTCSKASKDHFEHAACVAEMLEHRRQHGKYENAPKADSFDSALRKAASGFLDLDGVATATTNAVRPTTSTQKPQNAQQWEKVPTIAFKQEQKQTGAFVIGDSSEEEVREKRGIDLEREVVVRKDNYDIRGTNQGLSALGAIAKMMLNSLLAQKNKTESSSWQRSVQRIKLANKERKRLEQEGKLKKTNMPFDPESKIDMLERFAHRAMGENGQFGDLDPESPENMKKLAKDERLKKADDPLRKMLSLLREGIKLGYGIAGKNTTGFDDKIMKVVSPRFLSVVPEEDSGDVIDVISPSLFSLHNDGKGIENLTSLPNLVKTFNGADQQQWLDFIIEAAGVEDQATKLEREMVERKTGVQKKYEERIRGENGQPMFFTKENVTQMYGSKEEVKIGTFERLMKSYSKEQLKQMNDTGFAVLTKDQLYTMYGPDSPYNNSEILEKLMKVHPSQALELIEKDIHTMARYGHHRRSKRDITLSPIVFFPIIYAAPILSQAVILSPLVFSPIVGTPAVLGPIILSPWVFIPLILSPRVLSPLILTPMIFSPIVLSPLVLHPLILCPGIFNPVVLSPLVLSPLILSPQVFTPIILSPLVLNPLILNPMVGSPLVLSPFVLSPLILSPQALFAVVLSPYALSPLILSPLALAEVVLSPSWLS